MAMGIQIGPIGKFTKERNWPSWVYEKLMGYKPDIFNIKPPLALWMVDKRGIFTLSEGEGLIKMGQKPGEVIGKSIHEVYVDFPQMLEKIRLAIEGQSSHGVIQFDGLVWNVYFNPIHAADSSIVGAVSVAFDITEWQKLYRAQEIMASFASGLRKANDRSEMCPIILNKIANIFDSHQCALISLNTLSGELTEEFMLGDWDLPSHNPSWLVLNSKRILVQGRDTRFEYKSPIFTGFQRQISQYIQNFSDDHALATAEPFADKIVFDDLRPTQALYMAGIPLIANEKRIGVLWLGRDFPVNEDEIQLLVDIGDMVANALNRATQHKLTEQRLQKIASLHAIDKAITGSLDLRVTLSVLLDQVIQQLGVDASNVFLHDPENQNLNYSDGVGFNFGSLTRNSFKLGEGLVGHVALNRTLIDINDLSKTDIEIARPVLVEQERFVSYYGVPLITRGKLKGVLEVFHRQPLNVDSEWVDFLKTLSAQAAIAIETTDLFADIQQSNSNLKLAYTTTLEGWVRALDLRDKESEGHAQRVSKRTVHLGRLMGMSEEDLVHAKRGALLHDIGKIGIPDEILKKPGPLTDHEQELMRKHPVYAYEMLKEIDFLRPALDIPYYHHERWDGTGYPHRLKGIQIPLAARIFAVIDVWDALSSDRPYRLAWPEDKIHAYILDQAGVQFDPQVVAAWMEAFDVQIV
jgi:HD-GYP domain-containing protein (c-di-GMP phosphodiesterase class II)